MYHMSRKAPSIVKSSLHPHAESNSTANRYNPETNPGWKPFSNDLIPGLVGLAGYKVKGSYVCGVDQHPFKCVNTTGSETGKWWCRRYRSQDLKQRFDLHVDLSTNPRAKAVCDKTQKTSCWVISARPQSLSDKEKKLFCRNQSNVIDCSMYVQPGGHHIPAPADDNITWTRLFKADPDAGDGDDDDDDDNLSIEPDMTNGKILLGLCDTCYLVFYAAGMFVAGHIADHTPLNRFLAVGMIGSGVFVAMVGLAHKFEVHGMWYFYLIYSFQGLFQATGWPAVVAVMDNWFGKRTRGFVMGVWNAHTSIGNILGSVISGWALSLGLNGNDWPAPFYISGGLIATMGLIVLLFLPNHPKDLGLDVEPDPPDEEEDNADAPTINALRGNLLEASVDSEQSAKKRHSFFRALCIPGVLEFAFALFFCKFVAYMFIYWLPYYLAHNNFSPSVSANLSTAFDFGGILGGIVAGFTSDRLRKRSPIAFLYLAMSIPSLYMYRVLTKSIASSGDSFESMVSYNVLLMLLCGFFVNGPYALITTAVSADLGNHPSLQGDQSLTATVTGIIDGTGSIGASIQGVLIGAVTSSCDWDAVFYLLMIACSLSALCLLRLVW
eukprot:CAMPEP_0175120008 /NCGR_PEP_ID=MMETSP0087-20121206/384_1 /TAXON_ID=136419 /ORGANISM="Unknown Unknown, Strain D1" /LENGTH=607 /DNA_ID=CAMNT_0016401411 /DNA_START=124 /DNA_END=1944 /DNA_ORIENTATION=+